MRRFLPAVFVAALLAAPVPAEAAKPRLTQVRCVPPSAKSCRDGKVRVAIGKSLQLRGSGLKLKMRVTFRWQLGALATRLRKTHAGYIARVPAGTRAGTVTIYVTDRGGRRSNGRKIIVSAPPSVRAPVPPRADARLPDEFAGSGMWIWELPKSEGGNVDAIAARARAARMRTVFVKAADGTKAWAQFSPALVAGLRQRGLIPCAWQFVYGEDPEGEARAAADAIAKGAACFVIDAESKYNGRYAQAQRYLRALRQAVGADYPIGLTSFPYVDYHPGLPYSVFLGPGGAQVNLPQVYWKDIGDTVDASSAHTFAQNRIFGVPLAPLGQTYQSPTAEEITRFRAVWSAYAAGGLSWWSWQATAESGWAALGQPDPAPAALSDPGWPVLKKGVKGDAVVWMQQHLASADQTVVVDGQFGATTDAALRRFQESRGITPSGVTDDATWNQLLGLPLVTPDWSASGGTARAASTVTGPSTAGLPPKANEIPPAAGRR